MSERGATILGNNLLIRPDPLPEEIGSIKLPQQLSQRPMTGIIVEAGAAYDGSRGDVGNRVLFGAFAGIGAKFNGEKFLLMDPAEILAIIADPEDGDYEGAPV